MSCRSRGTPLPVGREGPGVGSDYFANVTEMKKFELKQSNAGYHLAINNGLDNLLLIPGGSFNREDGNTVTVKAFYLSQFPVTQRLYEDVTGVNPSSFKGAQHPVESVSWYDAVKFCALMNDEYFSSEPQRTPSLSNLVNLSDKELDSLKLNPTSAGFRLPTEAEWEYTARGNNNQNIYAGSAHLDLVGWYRKNNDYETKPVGLKFPNAFGLHDMSGNVWEWCWDWYGNYDKKKLDNPVGATSGTNRVYRGGSWVYDAVNCLPGYRSLNTPGLRINNLGFRLAFVP